MLALVPDDSVGPLPSPVNAIKSNVLIRSTRDTAAIYEISEMSQPNFVLSQHFKKKTVKITSEYSENTKTYSTTWTYQWFPTYFDKKSVLQNFILHHKKYKSFLSSCRTDNRISSIYSYPYYSFYMIHRLTCWFFINLSWNDFFII